MDSAFSSLFAEDDDLPVEESKPEAAAAPEATQEDTGAALEEAPLADQASADGQPRGDTLDLSQQCQGQGAFILAPMLNPLTRN